MKTYISKTILSALLLSSCGVETAVEFNPKDIAVPDARPIGLAGQASLALQDESSQDQSCERFSQLGVFGIPLGLACHTTPLVGHILYGEGADRDGDGELTCADYKEGEDNGLMTELVCNPDLASLENIVEMKFQTSASSEIAVSFADYDQGDDMEAVGSWSSTGSVETKFPTNLRIWTKEQADGELNGVFAAKLNSGSSGKVYFDLKSQGIPLAGEIDFRHQEDTSGCESEPSQDTCHYQNIRLQGPQDASMENAAPSMQLKILASSKDDPEFFLIEGSVEITADLAQKIWGEEPVASQIPEILSVREIYFRTVRSHNELWGSFDFKDENGDTLDLSISPANGIDVALGQILRNGLEGEAYAGICQNFGSDEQVACASVDATAYASIWVGDDEIYGLPSDYLMPIDMTSPPREYGVILK